MAVTLIIGLGVAGIGAARLLNEEGRKIVILEKENSEKIHSIQKKIESEGIKVETGKNLSLEVISQLKEDIQEIIISPGVNWEDPTLIRLRELNYLVKGEMSLAWERLNNVPWIGVTGTNGKTTVTCLLNHVLETNGKKAPMGGNVGFAASEVARMFKGDGKSALDWLIMEMSSYQIEASTEIGPSIGLWTSLTPDHLERHGTLEKYQSLKRGLINRSQIRIFNGDDAYLSSNRDNLPPGIWVSAKRTGTKEHPIDLWIDNKGIVFNDKNHLFQSSECQLIGEHNMQNMLMVTAAALSAGLSGEQIKKSLRTFPGLPHRLEKLGKINNIDIYNDSKATNFDAAKTGLIAIDSPSIVLAGGKPKEGDPTDWLNALREKSSGIVLFGEGARFLEELIISSRFQHEVVCCDDLAKATRVAIEISLKKNIKTIILSPACASFDQYQNFEERGIHFHNLIKPYLSTTSLP